MNQLIVNENYFFEIEEKGGDLFIDGESSDFDLKKISDTVFHVLHENKSYTAELVSIDRIEKKLELKINGNEYQISLRDNVDALLESLGMNKTAKTKENTLKSPMPGLVMEIFVKEGGQVSKGDNLLVLEAMKMENIIKSAHDGIIKSIEVTAATTVSKNQVLLTFE